MTITLGASPQHLSLTLVSGAPFAAAVTAATDWPAPPELVLDTGAVLPSVVDGATAAWLLTAEQVADLTAPDQPKRATLRDPVTHHAYAHGSVHVVRVTTTDAPSTVAPGGDVSVTTLAGGVTITYGGAGLTEDPDHPGLYLIGA